MIDKLIFLDIDGVLNSLNHYKNMHKIYNLELVKSISPNLQTYCSEYFDAHSVELLNKLCNKTGAKIVITSTWRLGKSLDTLKNIFRRNGISENLIIDKTGRTHFINGSVSYRDEEILLYLAQHYTDKQFEKLKYVVIDDDSFDLKRVEYNLVNVDTEKGFQDDDYKKALNILEK